MFLITGCGNAAVPAQEPPAPTEAESNTQPSGTEEKVAENTAVPTETAKSTEAVKEAAKEAESTDEAKVTDAAKEAEADALEINWDDVKTLDTPVTMYAQKQVNIRKGPDTQYDRLGTLSLNDEVSVIGECKSLPWKEIKFNDDVAFVHGDFLGTEKIDLEALKAAEEAAAATAAAQANQQQAQAA
ncbi:MAG: SH3 domain-containing protein [Lachnospiraceae bacterium]|nr:SH3 domain-containing protein [Lachnospiraceae bacterium]